MTDADARSAGSDSHEFSTWATDSGPDLMRFALAVTGNSHDAADAVQDALVAIYARWRRLSGQGRPDAYARRVIVNRQISWWRKIGRRESSTELPDLADADEDAGGDTVLAARLLRTLPAQQRAAVVLRYLEDLSFSDIAEILGCPESTARSHVHRALGRLREQLGDEHD
jgi:RNA polymerase sigma-70 factor (sigma-E family)